MRPVPTWNSTASSPTPYSDGPVVEPWRSRPWQVAQFAWNSFLPSSTVSAEATDVSVLDAIAADAPAYTPPVIRRPMPMRAAAAQGLRRPFERRLVSRAMLGLSSALFQEVDDEEQGDPDDVDEVPVVRHDDRGGHLFAPEVLDGVRATDHEQEGDEAARHVQGVEAGGDVERRRVRVRADRQPFRDELCVLPHLTRDEDRTECEREPEPLDHAPAEPPALARRVRLEALGREDPHLAGHR